MKERSFDEMIAYFNRRVSEMDIAQDYKMELLGMVTALGFKHEKSAQPERKKGKWIKGGEQPYFRKHFDIVVCSICNKRGEHRWNFCPNCGADMRGGQCVD